MICSVRSNKILVTTLTKRMAEDLTTYLREVGIRVRYLHSDIDTLERAQIIRAMRLDEFDVLVGINLLREGLDIPEISLVAILDADKEGFLRSETSLVQTIGRAARNAEGHVIMYADNMTDSMRRAISETERRRTVQEAYNKAHGITPTTIKKAVRDVIMLTKAVIADEKTWEKDPESMSDAELRRLSKELEKKMRQAAAELKRCCAFGAPPRAARRRRKCSAPSRCATRNRRNTSGTSGNKRWPCSPAQNKV